MAEAYFEIEEYLWITEASQGNVNVGGLVFDDFLEEEFTINHDVNTVWANELIADGLSFVDDYTPYHFVGCSERLNFSEVFGVPTRVAQAMLNVLVSRRMMPIKIAHAHIDVLHGSDCYWEELTSELYIRGTYVNAVPYYWETVYETIDIDMTEPQPEPPLFIKLQPVASDLVNMRHEVVQEYFFNSACFEQIFGWDNITWGWDKYTGSTLINEDKIQEIIGKVADEYLLFTDTVTPHISVLHIMRDGLFAFDKFTNEIYYVQTVGDQMNIEDIMKENYYIVNVSEIIDLTDASFGDYIILLEDIFDLSEYTKDAMECLISELIVFSNLPVVEINQHYFAQETLAVEETALPEWFAIQIAEETIDLTENSGVVLIEDKLIEESINIGTQLIPVVGFMPLAVESMVLEGLPSFAQTLIIEEGLALNDVNLACWIFMLMVEAGFDLKDVLR